MSSFNVITGLVADAGTRLGGISAEVNDLHGRIGACSGAASGTAVHGGLEGLLGRWTAVLPQFAEAGDRLSAALSGAAQAYAGTDGAVAQASGGTDGAVAQASGGTGNSG